MYVCICNALRERQLKEAATDARRVGEVFQKCGHRPQCGKCVPDIAKMISQSAGGARATSVTAT